MCAALSEMRGSRAGQVLHEMRRPNDPWKRTDASRSPFAERNLEWPRNLPDRRAEETGEYFEFSSRAFRADGPPAKKGHVPCMRSQSARARRTRRFPLDGAVLGNASFVQIPIAEEAGSIPPAQRISMRAALT